MYLTAKTTSQRPSTLLLIDDGWAAYQIDSAVVRFGVTIENLSHEREERGMGQQTRWVEKYTLPQLLDPDFRVPAPEPYVPVAEQQGAPDHATQRRNIQRLIGLRGVRVFRGKAA